MDDQASVIPLCHHRYIDTRCRYPQNMPRILPLAIIYLAVTLRGSHCHLFDHFLMLVSNLLLQFMTFLDHCDLSQLEVNHDMLLLKTSL